VPPNYRQQQGEPLQSHERKGALMLAGVVVAAAAGLGIWGLSAGGGAKPDGKCVSFSIASSTGGAVLRHCGADARTWCAAEATAKGTLADEIRGACRRAGFVAGG
jgi:hypothetical protein